MISKYQNIIYKIKSVFSSPATAPVFVLGNQKSGTTAIAALLAQATQKSLVLDLKRTLLDPSLQLRLKYGFEPFSKFIRKYRFEFSREIIKEPILTLFYQELKNAFPDAKFVFIVRDPRDNIRSILNRLKIPGNLQQTGMLHAPEIKKIPVWSLVMDTTWLGQTPDNYIDGLARRWNICCSNFEPDHQVLIRYEDFKNNKKDTIYTLANQLGFPVTQDISRMVNRQFQPKGDNSATWLEFFGRRNLARIETACNSGMRCFDYPRTVNDSNMKQ